MDPEMLPKTLEEAMVPSEAERTHPISSYTQPSTDWRGR